MRAGLAGAVREAGQYLARQGLAVGGAPEIVGMIVRVAARFGVSVSQKAAAGAIPLIGAAGGALVNVVFADHFQDMARGHFIVRRLERTYGEGLVRSEHERLPIGGAPMRLAACG